MRLRHLIPVIALLFACDDRRQSAATDALQYSDGYSGGMSVQRGRVQQNVALMSPPPDVPTSADLPPISAPDVTAAMVIRTATARVEVDSLEPAVADVRAVAARVGGFVANTQMQVGAGQLRSATLELKVPAPRFDEALAGLRPIGRLESVEVDAADVGEEYVDVTARMENARRLERRLIDLLATRTGKLKDVLDVEQALARVREEIERYEGRLRYLKTHTATSTLTVTVHEPVPVVGVAGTSVMGEAFKQAWRNFVGFLAVLVQSLGVVVPLAILAVAGWLGYRRWHGPRTRAA